MFSLNSICRTVWVKPLQVEKKQGQNGEYESKKILFKVASNRRYTMETVDANGQVSREYPTDFVLCRASGNTAQIIADNCSATDANGKIISRHLALEGHLETFRQPRNFELNGVPATIDGVNYSLNLTTTQEVDGLVFVVDHVEFLDPKPANRPTTVQGGTVSAVQVQPAQTAQTQSAQTTTVAQTAQTQPVVQTAQTVQTQPAQTVQVAPVEQTQPAMNPPQTQEAIPVIPEGYTGGESPF